MFTGGKVTSLLRKLEVLRGRYEPTSDEAYIGIVRDMAYRG